MTTLARVDSRQHAGLLERVAVRDLAAQARVLSAEAFVASLGPTALVARPCDEQMRRAEMQCQGTVPGPSEGQLDQLLMMLRSFHTLSAFFPHRVRIQRHLTLGRDPLCNAQLEDPSVSKLHATLTWSEPAGRWLLRDEGSTNGTAVNGEVLVEGQLHTLTNGDAVALGDFPLVFVETRTLRSQLLTLPISAER